MNIFWRLRAKRWAQHPPSTKKVIFIFGIVAICLLIYAAEQVFGPFGDSDILQNNRRMPRF